MISFSFFPKIEDAVAAKKEATGSAIAFILIAIFLGFWDAVYHSPQNSKAIVFTSFVPLSLFIFSIFVWAKKSSLAAYGITTVCIFILYAQIRGMIITRSLALSGLFFSIVLLGVSIRAIQATKYFHQSKNENGA